MSIRIPTYLVDRKALLGMYDDGTSPTVSSADRLEKEGFITEAGELTDAGIAALPVLRRKRDEAQASYDRRAKLHSLQLEV